MPHLHFGAGYSLDEAAGRYADTIADDPGNAVRARDAFVTESLPFADRLAARYRGRGVGWEDLRQVARLALVKAINKLDPERGSFTAYAALTVRGELRRHFRDTGWDLHVPRHTQEVALELWRVIDEFGQELARPPSRAELSARLRIAPVELEAALSATRAYKVLSLNAPAPRGRGHDDEPTELGDLHGGPDPDLEAVEDRVTLQDLLTRLPAREREILALRFSAEYSQIEIAKAMGISQMHVSRLLSRALTWLRAGMVSDRGTAHRPSLDHIESHPAALPFAVANEGGVVVVRMCGEIDADVAGSLRAALEFYARHAHAGVRIDLLRVPFIDAAGIAALAAAYGTARGRSLDFALVNASSMVTRTLCVAGLGAFVDRRSSSVAPVREPA
ncbi:MAG TPA: sigma-70 family RNA polymerase sigma factor [Asanoa sp.]|nr:sigma-70 family RNA polymerase sigma factor [Asanoa sp.]